MVAQGERLQDICRHDRVSFDTDKYVPPCFCVLQSSMLCSGSDAFPAAPHSFSSLIQSLPSCWGWVCRAPNLWGLRILEIVMENKGGVTIPRWAFGLAAAVVALLVVLVIVLIPRGKESTTAAGSTSSVAEPPATVTAPSASSTASFTSEVSAAPTINVTVQGRAICNVKVPQGKELSADVPVDYRWLETKTGIHYPTSISLGPHERQGRLGQCFAHTPAGAAFAAMNTTVLLGSHEVSSAERKTMLSNRLVSQGDPWAPDKEDEHIEGGAAIYGYSIQEYSADRAIVRVYIIAQKPGGSRNVGWVPVRMVWEEGDWRLDSEEPEMKASIATEEPAHYVPIGLDQYAAWGFKKS